MKHLLFLLSFALISFASFSQTNIPVTTQVTLTGVGTDVDGSVVSYSWKQVSGPANPVIVNSDKAVTVVKDFNTAGLYKFQMQITDNQGAIGLSPIIDVQVFAANIPPVAKASVDYPAIQLPK